MATQKEKLEWELQAYGCTAGQIDRMVKEQAFPGQELLFAAGILSDAQHLLEFDDKETARQYINRAKHIMFKLTERAA